jgi:simple sugar transport system substrate-binding protein
MDRLDRARLLQLAGASAAALAVPGLAAGAETVGSARGFLQSHPHWRFVFVNHATTNPFFLPARYGAADAASIYGVEVEWVGSARSRVGTMIAAMNDAIRQAADGIAVSVIDPHAFDKATSEAIAAGIPVIAYNADGSRTNRRLAYIGQDLYRSGLKVGARIATLVGEGDVYVFIATPGQANMQPRLDGILDAVRDSGNPVRIHVVPTGADINGERKIIEQTYKAHRRLRGMFAVDGGSTLGVAQVMRKYKLRAKGVRGGGYDLLHGTLSAINGGYLDFTIDQQPYLQGFLPVQQLFLYLYSDELLVPADTNTGLKFVTVRNVLPYLITETRYEGSSNQWGYPVR